MPPSHSSAKPASDFMEELLSGLQAPALPASDQSIRAPPRCTRKIVPKTSVLSKRSQTLNTLNPNLRNTSSPSKSTVKVAKFIVPPPLNASESTPCDVIQPSDQYCDLFEGIEDWDDLDLEEDHAAAPLPILSKEPISLCQSFIKCRVKTVDDAQWNAQKKRMEKQLQVILERENQSITKTLLLSDEWIDLALEPDNTLNLVSFPGSPPINLQLDPLVFSRSEPGHVIIFLPSLLISASIVANAPMCARRSILSTRLKLSNNEVGEAVVRGNIVHETIQNSVLPQNQDFEDLATASPSSIHQTWQMENLLAEARKACVKHLSDLFMIGKTVEEGVKMVSDHLEHIPKWAGKYLIDSNRNKNLTLDREAVLVDPRSNAKSESDHPRIGITGILDTEEEIWSPKYGLKGKIDASVQALVDENPSNNKIIKPLETNPRIFPLEIKTGKQPSGIEHIAQTMLYTLLMSDRYNVEVTAGLLYYTSRDDLIRVRAIKDELRHLIMARNQLAYYLHTEPTSSTKAFLPLPTTSNNITEVEDLAPVSACSGRPILPEPIDRDFACCRCFEVDGCMLYRKAVEGVDSLPPQKGIERLRELYQRKTQHLTKEHGDFFRRWEALISYEETELGKSKKQIWNMSAEEREQAGNAFANMVIDYSFNTQHESWKLASPMQVHRYIYCLMRSHNEQINQREEQTPPASLLLGHMSENDPIVISIQGKVLALARGFILELTAQHIVVGLDHRLEESNALPLGTNLGVHLSQYASARSHSSLPLTHYRIDKDELMAGMGRIRDNLAQLFLENGNSQLRELVVDLRKPKFDLSTSKEGFPESTNHLNEEQVKVITHVLSAKDYALVLGMPGTGKTTTIAELIKTLIKRGKKVLLTSYTHSAVDNILCKLITSNIDMLRLGNVDKVAPALHRFTLHESNSPQSVKQLETRLMSPLLVATTSLSINHPIFSRRSFDYCIVDEASQVTLPTCLGPLRYAKVFVLVGDHYQLPPLVKNPRAKAGGLETSLFKLLTETHPDAVAALTMQYRMNEDIMSLSNALIYDGRLRSGDKSISNLSLEVPLGFVDKLFHSTGSTACDGCWLSDLLQPERKVVFANTDFLQQQESKTGNRLQNEAEAQLVFQLVNALVQGGVAVSDIGIITPYRQQLKLLMSLSQDFPDLEILTADKSQGRDKECIIMTMVRNNSEEEVGELLKDWRRINVCLTRAKKKLVIFGSKNTLKHSQVLNDLFCFIEKRNWIYDIKSGSLDLHQKIISLSRQSNLKSTLELNFISGNNNNNDKVLENDSHSHISKRGPEHFSPVRKIIKRPNLTPKNSLSINSNGNPFNNYLEVLRDVTLDFLADNISPPNK